MRGFSSKAPLAWQLFLALSSTLASSASARADDARERGGRPVVSDGSSSAGDAGVPERDASSAAVRPSWTPKLRATVKPALAHVGDPIEVRITVTHRQGVSVTLPLRLELGAFSELSRDETHRVIGPEGQLPLVEQSFKLRVAAYALGEHTIPPIELNALGPGGELVSLKTSPVPIRIGSVMANEPQPKLKPGEPPIRVFRRSYLLAWVLGAIALVALIVLLTLLIYKRAQARRHAERPPPPALPAHVLALERLDQLDVERLLREQNYKQLYLELSEIVREYIGRIWQLDALEMTTEEIALALRQRDVAEGLRERIERHFRGWDLVKFAKLQPDEADARAAVDSARAFVHDTRGEGARPDASASPGASASPEVPAAGAAPADRVDTLRSTRVVASEPSERDEEERAR